MPGADQAVETDYAEAFEEWDASGEKGIWDETAHNGLSDEPFPDFDLKG